MKHVLNMHFIYPYRRPYSFGLGKRAGDDNDDDSLENAQSVSYDSWQMNAPQRDTVAYEGEGKWMNKHVYKRRNSINLILFSLASEKRARPYSFGLGKRLARIEEASIERRAAPNRYNFGLGKR